MKDKLNKLHALWKEYIFQVDKNTSLKKYKDKLKEKELIELEKESNEAENLIS